MKVMFYLIVMLCLIIFPDDTAQSAWNALSIWGKNVVPVLFPYMFFSRMLCASIDGSRFPPVLLAASLGMLGGSPSGAMFTAGYIEKISSRNLYTLIALTGTISPMFLLGTLRAWTNDSILCRSLLLCHWLGAALSALFVHMLYQEPEQQRCVNSKPAPSSSASLTVQSIDAILQVGGCIISYSVLAAIIGKLPIPLPHFHMLLHAALEISGGAYSICQSSLPVGMRSILLSAALGFSGFSILSQNHAMLMQIGISMKQLFCLAILRAICSAICMALLQCL
ncbi:MAG: hypothetical protein E7321_04910 [Clostridiales bacterium]|nr:hypothetical protein [Clostridiales bacterium]